MCKNIPDIKFVEILHTNESLPEEVQELQVVGGYPLNDQVRKCQYCGTYYLYHYDHDSESGVGYGYTFLKTNQYTTKYVMI